MITNSGAYGLDGRVEPDHGVKEYRNCGTSQDHELEDVP